MTRAYALVTQGNTILGVWSSEADLWKWLNEQELPLDGGPYRIVRGR